MFDLGVSRGVFPAGARSYYGRDVTATTVPDLSSYAAAEANGVPRYDSGLRYDSGVRYPDAATATAGTHIPMALPSADEVGTLLTEFRTLINEVQAAEVNTDQQQEELSALYGEAQALAVDICDTVEFYYRKDPEDSSRRQKCTRWGVVYVSDTTPDTPAVATPAAATTTTPAK